MQIKTILALFIGLLMGNTVTEHRSAHTRNNLSFCDYSTEYAPIYDTPYEIAFVFVDEDELEDSWSEDYFISPFPSQMATMKENTSDHHH